MSLLLPLQGVFHVECKYTSRGARLIEVNCRMGGGPVRNINLLVWGVDLVEEHLLTTAGIPSRPPVSSRPLMHIAEFSSNAKKTGAIKNDDFCKVNLISLSIFLYLSEQACSCPEKAKMSYQLKLLAMGQDFFHASLL